MPLHFLALLFVAAGVLHHPVRRPSELTLRSSLGLLRVRRPVMDAVMPSLTLPPLGSGARWCRHIRSATERGRRDACGAALARAHPSTGRTAEHAHNPASQERIIRTRTGFFPQARSPRTRARFPRTERPPPDAQVIQELEPQISRPGRNSTFCVQQVRAST